MGAPPPENDHVTDKPTQCQLDDSRPDEADTPGEPAEQLSRRTPLFEANSAARYQRQEIIRQIQVRTRRRLICYVSGRACKIDEDDAMPFVDLLYNLPQHQGLELLLHTHGGSIDAAEKLIRMVRSKVGEAEFRIVVPEFAKSAGTLMVLGADAVVMSDMSELGPIDPQMIFADSSGLRRWQSVQNYLDAYEEHSKTLAERPDDVAARIMLGKLDPATVKLCQAAKMRAEQCAGDLLRRGMFRLGGNWTLTVSELLETKRWRSHSQMISWEDAQHPDTIGLTVEYHEQDSPLWQDYWRLYCLQRLAVGDSQKLYESDYASLIIDSQVM